MADHQHDTDDGGVHVHIHSWKLYAGILGALLVLTVITVAVSLVDVDELVSLGRGSEGVGPWNLTIAIAIATVKASLVVTFFMHLKDDKRFNAVFFLGSILFIGVFFAYTMNDTYFRGRVGDRYNGVHIDPDTGERAPGGIAGAIPGQVLEEGLEDESAEAASEAEATDGEAAPAADAEGADKAAEGDDFINDILGEGDGAEAADGADAAEGDDFINDILGDDGEAPAEPADGAEPADAPDDAPEAAEAPEAAPTPAPRAAPAAEEAPSQPEPEPEPEASE